MVSDDRFATLYGMFLDARLKKVFATAIVAHPAWVCFLAPCVRLAAPARVAECRNSAKP